jgi:5-methylthioadenosine/S-adenosylhomocysteine deaminase
LITGALALAAPAITLADIAAGGAPAQVDLLILGPDIVTFDDLDTVVAGGAIAVKGNAIVWIGKTDDARERFRATQTINAAGQLAMPGMTDTHFHTGQQFLRGVERLSHRKGPVWKTYLIPFESGLDPEDVYNSGLVGYTSLISSGTTCFLEAGGPHPDEMGRAGDEVGIRGRIALSTCDIDGPGGPLMRRW